MKAAVLHSPGNYSLSAVPTPAAGSGELLLKVQANTICGTDLRLIAGTKTAGVRPGVILGHEFCGVIAEVGQGITGYREGQQVSVSPAVVCDQCPQCQSGLENMCQNLRLFGYEFDGGLAQYVRIPVDAMQRGRVVATTHEVPPPLLALTEPLSCCLNGQRLTPVTPEMTVLVVGTGAIGLIHTALAVRTGARVIAAGREGRLAPALTMGADEATALSGADLQAFVMDRTGGLGADLVIVCASSLELATSALGLVRPGGAVNFFAGFPAGQMAPMDANAIHYRQITVTGSSNARLQDHDNAVKLISTGELDLSSLVTHTFPLDRFEDALTAVRERRGIKVAVTQD